MGILLQVKVELSAEEAAELEELRYLVKVELHAAAVLQTSHQDFYLCSLTRISKTAEL